MMFRQHAIVAAALVLLLTACRASAEPPVPTREPAPTFTPTLAEQPPPVDPAAAAAAATTAAQQTAQAAQPNPEQPAEQPAEQPTEQPTEPPTATPTPVLAAEVVINSNVNVRGGPGTTYNILGAAIPGERFPVTGKNQAGDWWQINFYGQAGWVFGALVTAQNAESVEVALNIPAPPPPTATSPAPPPADTPVPQPAEQPTPAPAPSQNYEFNRALVQRCDPNEGVTYVQGTVYKNSSPVNGYLVTFSYAPDGPQVATVISGPHTGYEGWGTGFYSHILQSNGAREGNWFFWIVDGSGTRISAIANVHTDGEAGDGKCQQAVVDFDS